MAARIEDYALIGDTQTAGLVSRDGSLDWLCLPRFDSGACFAALLGNESNGRWRIAPSGGSGEVRRCYRDGTLILETEFHTPEGVARLVDFMPPRKDDADVIRIVEGVSGRVELDMQLIIRFDYGSAVPWVRRLDGVLVAVAGPDALYLWSDAAHRGEGMSTVSRFAVSPGDEVAFRLVHHPSHLAPPLARDPRVELAETEQWWRAWSGQCRYEGRYEALVRRSLLTLKALTYGPTGGIVAAPTTSLPEQLGGVRNWDYRYCWVRDATFTLYTLQLAGYEQEAVEWRDWLLRAAAGEPAALQIMYGVAGERRLPELELGWLGGYEGASPVRIGNGASTQCQLDVYGEILDVMHQSRKAAIPEDENAWALQLALLAHLEGAWRAPDEGIWEVRGPRRHFTHSKVMAWVAADRAVKAVERFGRQGPVERWRRLRAEIHDEVCRQGWNPSRQAFTQYYGGRELDASLLMIALVGFLPPSDPRVVATVEAVERELSVDGFVRRYDAAAAGHVDGLPPGEGAFLACSFWLADNLMLIGRGDDARRLFERVAGLANDVGLLPEQYDPAARRFVGNFPQALTHVSLVDSAYNLHGGHGPAARRGAG